MAKRSRTLGSRSASVPVSVFVGNGSGRFHCMCTAYHESLAIGIYWVLALYVLALPFLHGDFAVNFMDSSAEFGSKIQGVLVFL